MKTIDTLIDTIALFDNKEPSFIKQQIKFARTTNSKQTSQPAVQWKKANETIKWCKPIVDDTVIYQLNTPAHYTYRQTTRRITSEAVSWSTSIHTNAYIISERLSTKNIHWRMKLYTVAKKHWAIQLSRETVKMRVDTSNRTNARFFKLNNS